MPYERAKNQPAGKTSGAASGAATRDAALPTGESVVSATPITDGYIAKGDFNPLWQRLRELDPEFMEAYLAFRDVPHRNGPLPPHFKELILVAINAATTHLYAPGLRRHMQNALRLGASPEEVLETIQLTTVMGIHSCNLAIPILVEEMERSGVASGRRGSGAAPAASTARRGRSKPRSTVTPASATVPKGPKAAEVPARPATAGTGRRKPRG